MGWVGIIKAILRAGGLMIAEQMTAALFLKGVMVALTMTVLPVILFKTWLSVQGYVMNMVMSFVESNIGLSATTIQLTQFGAWLGAQLNIAQCVSVLLSFVTLGFALRMIR